MCEHELNEQIKGLQARLSQAENNITSHFYATSMLVQGLLSSPAASAAAIVEDIYNLLPTGFELMQKLIDLVDPGTFKEMMMAMASQVLDGMVAELEGMVTGVVDILEASIASTEALIVDAEDSLADAITGGIPAVIDAAQAELDGLTGLLLKQQGGLSNAVSFLTAQANAANCKSGSILIKP